MTVRAWFALAPWIIVACAPAQDRDSPVACATGEILDLDVCVPAACGVGTWGELAVDEDTVYVDVAADDAGDGSESTPLRSIQSAVDLSGGRGGGLVAVAAGTYMETLSMGDDHKGVTLAGRCRELVTVDGREGNDAPVVEIVGVRKRPDVGIEGVALTGGTYMGIRVEGANVTVTRVDVRENSFFGLYCEDAELALDAVSVTGTLPERGAYGHGIIAQGGCSMLMSDTIISGNTEVGLGAFDAETRVEVTNTTVSGGLPNRAGVGGDGIAVQDGAVLTASGCVIQQNTELGVLASSGSSVTLVDTVVTDTLPCPDGSYGRGIGVQGGATLTMTRSTISGNTEAGLFVGGAGTTVDMTDTDILDTLSGPDGLSGWGISAQDGAVLIATRSVIRGNC